MNCPRYLQDYQDLWNVNHKQAVLKWFQNAQRGLFLHYGLYSLMHKHEWCMYHEQIPIATYEKLTEFFTAHNFDADRITDFALENNLKYINLTTCHHDSFCLWDSKVEPFNVMHTPAQRDLVGELSEACDRKGLGFFAYYTFMQNWRHPYFIPRSLCKLARPDYKDPEPRYLYKDKEDFKIYIQYIQDVMEELLSNYKVTGIWLDLISNWYKLGPDYIPIEEIYQNIRTRHPEVLISWKSGATGTEDFASPEHVFKINKQYLIEQYGQEGADRAVYAFTKNADKHNEICTTMQESTWAFCPECGIRKPMDVARQLRTAQQQNCNLLINIGPMADGSLSPVLTQNLAQAVSLYDAGNIVDETAAPASATEQ